MVGLVLLSSLVRCSRAVRIQRRVMSVLMLREAVRHSEKERTTVVFLSCIFLLARSAYCGLFGTALLARIVIGILHAANFTTHFPMEASRSAQLRMESAMRSRTVNGTLYLAINLAKFLFAFDSRSVIPPRKSAIDTLRSGLRPRGDPLLITGPAGAAGVPALGFCR